MLDQFGRTITYLRISVIAACNLRCLYCMPHGLVNRTRMDDLLTNDELVTLAGIFAELGIRKIRLTGGEPLLRPGLVNLVRRLADTPGIEQLALSTNGVLLARHAHALRAAGLQRVNVSLDTLSPENFIRIAGMDAWQPVIDGIREARAAGLGPVKLNTVVMNGINDHEILPLVDFAISEGCEIRFIEWMPTNPLVNLQRDGRFFSNELTQARIESRYRLIPDDPDPASPARSFRIAGSPGRVGFINPLSNYFCARCNRVRLKVNGRIKTCLHGQEELDLRAMLRSGEPHEAISRRIATAVFLRPEQHFLNRSDIAHNDFVMTHVGG